MSILHFSNMQLFAGTQTYSKTLTFKIKLIIFCIYCSTVSRGEYLIISYVGLKTLNIFLYTLIIITYSFYTTSGYVLCDFGLSFMRPVNLNLFGFVVLVPNPFTQTWQIGYTLFSFTSLPFSVLCVIFSKVSFLMCSKIFSCLFLAVRNFFFLNSLFALKLTLSMEICRYNHISIASGIFFNDDEIARHSLP